MKAFKKVTMISIVAVILALTGCDNQDDSHVDFKQLPGHIGFKNERGEYIWANTGLTKAAGTNVIGKMDTDASISWHETGEKYIGYLKKTIDSGHQQEFVEVAPVDGKPVIYLSVINPTKDSNDKITGVSVNVVKITPDMLQKLNQTMQDLDN